MIEDGRYSFKALGAPVGSLDGLLWAFVVEEPAQEVDWNVIRDVGDPEGNAYVCV